MRGTKNCQQRGFVLATALIFLLSLTLIAVTMAYRNTIDEMMAANQRDAVNAMTIAESGQADAYMTISTEMSDADTMNANYFTDGYSGGYVGLQTVSQSGGGYVTSVKLIDWECADEGREPPDCEDEDGNSGSMLNPGSYDFGDLVVINAVGTVNGAEREVETIHEYTTFTSQHAVLTEDDLELKGSAEVLDDYAFVHSNSDILVTGQTQVDQTVSASGDITIQGVDAQLLGTPDILIGQPRVDIPYINPLDFRDDATIILTWDCKVLNALGTQIATADTNNKYRGWNCNQGTNLWTMGSAAGGPNPLGPLSAFYYVEGNVQVGSSSSDHSAFASTCSRDPVIIYGDVVSGSPTVTNLSDLELNDAQVAMSVSGAGIPGGTNVQSIDFLANTLTLSQNANLSGTNVELTLLDTSYCWKVTIVAEGNIVIGGDFDMQPYAPPLLFLAGNDLSLRGQASQSLDGLAAAHQEVDIAGSMRLEGSVIAENGYWAAGQQVTTNRQVVDLVATNSISGQGQVVKKNESNTPFAKLVELAWRELVD